MESKYPGGLVSQFIPMDPELWKIERYEDFLEARRNMMALKLNEFMNSLIVEPEKAHHRPIQELITLGESYVLEFKSTLQWDVVQNQQNSALRFSCLKTVAAFLNSQGGTLVIGVEDDGNVFGLGRDFSLAKNSQDKFEQLLVSLIASHIGPAFSPYYRVRFEDINGQKVCVVDVERSPEPVFLKNEKGKQFFVRIGNTSRPLDTEESLRYVEVNWD